MLKCSDFSRVSFRAIVNMSLASGLLIAGTSVAYGQFLGTPPSVPAAPPASSAAQPTQPDQSSVFLPGDSFDIQVFGVAQYSYKLRVDDDGTAAVPLVGDVHLGGMTIGAAQKLIEEKLESGNLINDPHVILHITETPNRFVTVTGEVKTPGPVQVYGDKHLLDVIASAGGFTPASSPTVTVYKRGSQEPIQIELPTDPAKIGAKNIAIHPGDSVVVSKLGVVYVLGAFHTQGAVPLRNDTRLTLLQAMSLAGGVNYEASLNKAFILRSSLNGPVEIPFNVKDVTRHRVPDQILQNEDVILIPTSTMKAAIKGGAASVAASLLVGVGYITAY